MNIKPILFNTEMVRAILEGRKAQTRRVIKGVEEYNVYGAFPADGASDSLHRWEFSYGGQLNLNGANGVFDGFVEINAPAAVGDILWVRETWNYGYIESSDREGSNEEWFEEIKRGGFWDSDYIKALCFFAYKTEFDSAQESRLCMKWKPSIHMPKEAARIFLRVTNVRPERLNDIGEDGAIAEGVPTSWPMNAVYCTLCNGEGQLSAYDPVTFGATVEDCPDCSTAVRRFKNLWNSTLKGGNLTAYGWDANPWVWVIEFERCEKPEGWCKECSN